MRLIWTPEAVSDLNRIYEFYAAKNLRAAAVTYNSVLDSVEKFKTSPHMASTEQLLDDLPQKFRSMLVSKGRFKAIYFVDDGKINIVYIWNCRQNPQKMRKRFV
jgi:plasmid stabilization system protein ParE